MEQLWFTKILNHLFAGPVTSFLRMLHLEPRYPRAPISNSFSMELLVFFFLLVLFLMVRSRLSVESPGGLQHAFEAVEGFVLSASLTLLFSRSYSFSSWSVI
jgi:F-type H+-transporting ATPase subunit a